MERREEENEEDDDSMEEGEGGAFVSSFWMMRGSGLSSTSRCRSGFRVPSEAR